MLQATCTTAQAGPAALLCHQLPPNTCHHRMTLLKLCSTHVLKSTHVAPCGSLPVKSGLNFLLWLSDPPSHSALCLSNPFSPYFPNLLSSLLPHPCDSSQLITCSRCCWCPTQTPVSRLAPHALVQGTKDLPSCLQGGQIFSASPTPELLLHLSRISSLPGLSSPHLSCFPHFLTNLSLERTPSKITPTRIPQSGFAPRKPHMRLPCHLGSYLETKVTTNYTSRQATPEVTGQKGLQTKLLCFNHVIYLINLKHSEWTSLVV